MNWPEVSQGSYGDFCQLKMLQINKKTNKRVPQGCTGLQTPNKEATLTFYVYCKSSPNWKLDSATYLSFCGNLFVS